MIELNDNDVWEGGNDPQKYIIGDTADYINEMHTYTMSYDDANNGVINFSVDGELVKTFENVGTFTSSYDGKLIIGADIDNSSGVIDSDPFTGTIDNVKIYSTSDASEDSLVAHYDFNDFNPLENKAGDNYDGVLAGGADINFTIMTIENDVEFNLSAIDDGQNIDTINLGTGNQDVTLTLNDVMNITDDDNRLRIDGLPGDTVHIDTTNTGTTGEWTLTQQDSNGYDVYTGLDNTDLITLEISTQIHVDES
jgi:hypothetical protein